MNTSTHASAESPRGGYEKTSKKLAYILRHNPGAAELTLNAQGWGSVQRVCQYLHLSRTQLRELVEQDSKGRYQLSADGQRIRAVQGHSIPVDLALAPVAPPPQLYHGTSTSFLQSIFKQGLKPQQRTMVHLSSEVSTAHQVASRRAKPCLLLVDTGAMVEEGFLFYQAENGVWLTAEVPARFLTLSSF